MIVAIPRMVKNIHAKICYPQTRQSIFNQENLLKV